MKAHYLFLSAVLFSIALTGCKNRFEEYEPYSTFDERMASASRPTVTPDDQMPPSANSDDQYAYNNYSSGNNASSSGSSGDGIEVPFSETRGKEHPAVNVGAL
jgi:hypothetical protein